MRGSFQASFLGISIMTGSVTFYLTMQWPLSCSLCSTEFRYLLLWEDGIACSWLQMFATHNVFCGSGSILLLFVTAWSSTFLTSYAFMCINSESSAQMPSQFDFSRIPSFILISNRTHLNAANIVNCVHNFLSRYSGTFMKNLILSSVKICCLCLHFASLVLVRYLIPWQLRLVTSQG